MANEIYIRQRNGNGPRVLRKLTPTANSRLKFNSSKVLTIGDSSDPAAAYAASGAIAVAHGPSMITKSSAAGVMTLVAPTATTHDGVEMSIISTTAQAHTVTQTTPGFNNGGSASDVATFGGAIGDNLVIVAYQGVWYVKSKVNITLG